MTLLAWIDRRTPYRALLASALLIVGSLLPLAVAHASGNLMGEILIGGKGTVTGEGTFYGVSCSRGGDCVAAGDMNAPNRPQPGQTLEMFASSSGGTWGPVKVIPGQRTSGSTFTSMACAGSSFCVVIGTDLVTRASTYAVLQNGVAGPTTKVPAARGDDFRAITCPAVGDCVAVGSSVDGMVSDTMTNGSWGTVTSIPNSNIDLANGFSCSDTSNCTVVGWDMQGSYYFVESNGVWGPVLTIPPAKRGGSETVKGISCSSFSDCTAVGTLANGATVYSTESGGVWGATTTVAVPGGGTLQAVSCVDATDCTAVGASNDNQLLRVTETNGVWGPAVLTRSGGVGALMSVSCTDATDCTAVGYGAGLQALYDTEVNGAWYVAAKKPPTVPRPVTIAYSSRSNTLTAKGEAALMALAGKLNAGARVTVIGYANGSIILASGRVAGVEGYLGSWASIRVTFRTVTNSTSNKVTVITTKN